MTDILKCLGDPPPSFFNSNDVILVHKTIKEHYDFCIKLGRLADECIEHIVMTEHPNRMVVYVAYVIDQLAKKMINNYVSWRVSTGKNEMGVLFSRCSGGGAHGWDAVTRVYLLECLLYNNCLLGHTKKEMLAEYKLTMEERNSLVSLSHPVLLMDSSVPLHRWCARITYLQLRTIAVRWNTFENTIGDNVFLTAVKKLIHLCRLRSYHIVEQCVHSEDTQIIVVPENEKGLNSSNFNGKIVCTPQNNCGVSALSSFGSYFDIYTWMMSRISTKLLGTIETVHQCIPQVTKEINTKIFNLKAHEWRGKIKQFNEYIKVKARLMLERNQLQSQITRHLFFSIMGIDILVRNTDMSYNVSDDDVNQLAKQSTSNNILLYITDYLDKDIEVFMDNPELFDYTVLYCFETLVKKDGRNPVGFISPFYLRTDLYTESLKKIEKGMKEMHIPCIVKTSRDYVVSISGKTTNILCSSLIEALYIWGMVMKHGYRWKIGILDFSHHYEPIFLLQE